MKTKNRAKDHTIVRPLPNLGLPVSIAVIVAIAALTIAECTYDGDVLFRVQELNLFLYTPLFFQQQLVVPGGFLTWAGTYFTQFFFHPWLGATLLSLWWLLMVFVMARAFHIPAKWCLLLLVPVALLFITDADMGYWIYYLKLRGHYFLTTIGVTAAIGAVWLYRLLPSRWFLRTAYIVVTVAVGYPLLGAYGLFAVLLMGIMAWQLPDYKLWQRATDSVIALAAIIATPIIYYYAVYYQTNIANIYFAALPTFTRDETYAVYFVPYVLLAVFLIVMATAYGHWQRIDAPKVWKWATVQCVIVAAVVVGIYESWYKDEAFHTEICMDRCVENLDWDGVLQAYRDFDESKDPTRIMWLYKNIALFHKGTILEDMYRYRNGRGVTNASFPTSMAQTGGKTVYFHHGQINFCQRWCMESGVEYGWRIDYLRYLLFCSLANGEDNAAQKYIDILKKTKYYRAFAEKYQAYVGHPQIVKRDAMFKPVLRLMPLQDVLTSDQAFIELYLIDQFAYSDSKDLLYETMSMASALQRKDIATFWDRFFHYAPMIGNSHMPSLVQQAAYLFGHLEHNVDISHMPFDKEVVDTYNAFMNKAQSSMITSEEEAKPLFYSEFGGTYYFDYFFFRNSKSDQENEHD